MPIAAEFADWKACARETFKLAFPGCGGAQGRLVTAGKVEYIYRAFGVPNARRERVLVIEHDPTQRDSPFRVIDDFVTEAHMAMKKIEVSEQSIRYFDRNGVELLIRARQS